MFDRSLHRNERRDSTRSVVAISLPGDFTSLKRYSNKVSVVAVLAAMNDFPAKRNKFFKGHDLHRFARLPGTLGNHASSMGTDVFGVSQLSRLQGLVLNVSKMHSNSDRETLFHSSVESWCDGHMTLR
jgi:hypothetical protein